MAPNYVYVKPVGKRVEIRPGPECLNGRGWEAFKMVRNQMGILPNYHNKEDAERIAANMGRRISQRLSTTTSVAPEMV